MVNFDSLNDAYDAIIIGAGIGGLNCAASLSLVDKKVLVLEKNAFIGGRCSSYQKDGYTVDYCIHVFANGEDGPLHQLLRKSQRYFKTPLITWKRVGAKLYYKNSAIQVNSPLNFTHFWNYFKSGWNFLTFKAPMKEKMDFFKVTQKIIRFPPSKLDEIANLTVKEFINQYSTRDMVHNIYSTLSASYSVVPYSKSAAKDFLAVCKNTLGGKGVSYPLGGAAALADAYQKIIEFKGGHVLTSTPVSKILVEDVRGIQRTIGVKVGQNREILANCVISNVDLKTTCNKLLDPSTLDPQYMETINALEQSDSTTVVHLALDKKLIKDKFVVKAQTQRAEFVLEQREKGTVGTGDGCFITVPSNIDPSLAPPGKQLILGGQSSLYEQEPIKDDIAAVMLEIIGELVKLNIKLTDHIEWMDVIGPKGLNDLFGETGATVGLAQKIGQIREDRPDSRSPLSGLYYCGDDSGIGLFGVGTEIAAKSGQQCAQYVIEDSFLIE